MNASLPLPSWYERSLIGSPWFQPNADVIQAAAYELQGKYGVKKASKDKKRIFRLHVDEQPDFTQPFTAVDTKNGRVRRFLPAVFKNVIEVPKWWKEQGDVMWSDEKGALDILGSLSVFGGRLSVPNSWNSTMRSVEWDFANAGAITTHGYTIDFHPLTARFDMHYWQVRANNPYKLPAGAHPHMFMQGADKPFPIVTPDIVWHPQHNPDGWLQCITRDHKFLDETWDYVNKLGVVVLWTKHCHRFTGGSNLDPIVMAGAQHHAFLRGWLEAEPMFFPKGMTWRTEFFGVFGPEYEIADDPHAQATFSILQLFEGFPDQGIPPYDEVIVTGQARTHCVLRSMEQAVKTVRESNRPDCVEKIVYLLDTTDDIPGFEDAARKSEAEMKKLGVRMETTKSYSLVK